MKHKSRKKEKQQKATKKKVHHFQLKSNLITVKEDSVNGGVDYFEKNKCRFPKFNRR